MLDMNCQKRKMLTKWKRTAVRVTAALFAALGMIYFSVVYTLHEGLMYEEGCPPVVCKRVNLFSSNERFRDAEGDKVPYYDLSNVQPGDILVTMSNHTLGYRHGHSGLVVGEGKTLEAVYLGKETEMCDISRWESCPTLIQLRVSEDAAEKVGVSKELLGEMIAKTALDEGCHIRYSMFPNIFNYNCDTMKRTHCSHLVWYVFNQYGIDVNSDGGLIVTPWDIVQSEYLEVIQVHGIDVNSFKA